MIDVKKEKLPTNQLALGMFIAELDKPWIESDFLLQGFVLEDQADLDKLVSTCAYVYVDRTKSIGDQFSSAKKHDVAVKRHATLSPNTQDAFNKNTPFINKARQGEKVSFMDILREVKGYQKPDALTNEGTSYKIHTSASVTSHKNQGYSYKPEKTQVVTNNSIVGSIANFFTNWFGRNKSETSIKNDFGEIDLSHLSKAERILYDQALPVEEEIAAIYPVFEQSEIVTRDIFDAIANKQKVDISGVSDVLDIMVESIGRTPDALLWLAKLKKADGLSYNLALNVSVTLMAFSSFLALSKEQIKISGFAGLLQDVGKAKLSSDVLLKKGKLTKEEFEYTKKHVDESLLILKETPDIPMEVISLVAQHHERIDGSGYPSQLKGDQISLLSQAAGLIDTYCAMTNDRSHAQATYHQLALDKIHALSGKEFSNEIVNQLVQFMGIYPVSSLVELNTGEIGVVVQQNQVRRLMPRVMLLLDPKKERYGSPIVLDLICKPKTPSGDLYSIIKGVPADSYGLNPHEFYV